MRRTRILLAEDEFYTRLSMNIILKKAGYQVTVVPNGATAMNCINMEPNSYDLLMTDALMPEISGEELIQNLKDKQIDIPSILFSGSFEKIDARGGRNIGCDEYMAKPFTKDELLGCVRRVIQKSEEKLLPADVSDKNRLDSGKQLLDGENLLSGKLDFAFRQLNECKVGEAFASARDCTDGCDLIVSEVASSSNSNSFFITMLKAFFIANNRSENSGKKLFENLNKCLLSSKPAVIASGLHLRINLREMWIDAVSVGLSHLYRYKSQNPFSVYKPLSLSCKENIELGMSENIPLVTNRFAIEPYDRIIIFTKEMPECLSCNFGDGDRQRLGGEGVRMFLRRNFKNSIQDMVSNTWDDVMAYSDNSLKKNMLMLGFDIPPKQ